MNTGFIGMEEMKNTADCSVGNVVFEW